MKPHQKVSFLGKASGSLKGVIVGFLLAMLVIPIALLSFVVFRAFDNALYNLFGVNTANAFWLLWIYAALKIVLGFCLGMFYIPIKIMKFNSYFTSTPQNFVPGVGKTLFWIFIAGALLGMGSLGFMDLTTMSVVRFLY